MLGVESVRDFFFFSPRWNLFVPLKGSHEQSVSRKRDHKRQNQKEEELEPCVYALRNIFLTTKLHCLLSTDEDN